MTNVADPRENLRELSILGRYDPGQFVFDYFNDTQMKDLAQSLGLDLAQSREIRREKADNGNWKVTVKVVEVGSGAQRSTAESAAHAGALQTATLSEVLVRLSDGGRLYVLSHPSVEDTIAGCQVAVRRLSWAIVDGVAGRPAGRLRTDFADADPHIRWC